MAIQNTVLVANFMNNDFNPISLFNWAEEVTAEFQTGKFVVKVIYEKNKLDFEQSVVNIDPETILIFEHGPLDHSKSNFKKNVFSIDQAGSTESRAVVMILCVYSKDILQACISHGCIVVDGYSNPLCIYCDDPYLSAFKDVILETFKQLAKHCSFKESYASSQKLASDFIYHWTRTPPNHLAPFAIAAMHNNSQNHCQLGNISHRP
jgi:hypothetical protein